MAFTAHQIPGIGSDRSGFYEAIDERGVPADRIVRLSSYVAPGGGHYHSLENPTHVIFVYGPFNRNVLAAYLRIAGMTTSEDEGDPQNAAQERAFGTLEEQCMPEQAAHEFSRPMTPDDLAKMQALLAELALNSDAPTIEYVAGAQ